MDIELLRQKWQKQARVNCRLRGHELIPQALRQKLLGFGTQSDKKKADIYPLVKLFHPFSHWYWYVYGMDHSNQDTLYCYVLGDYAEYGTVSLLELEGFNVRGLPLERDLYYEPQSLVAIDRWHKVHEPEGLRSW